MKSKTSATMTSMTIVAVNAPTSMDAASAVLEHDALDDERDVLALVRRQLEQLVYRLELYQLAGVFLLAEQARDRRAHDAVRVGLERVHFLADLEDGLAVVHGRELRDRVMHLLAGELHQ